MRGASALDQLLAAFPDAPIRVHVIWEPVLKTDIAPPFTTTLRRVGDRRVTQYWDPKRIVSDDIVRAVSGDPARYGRRDALPEDFIAWDVVAVFARSERWEGVLPAPAYYGGPVVHVADAAKTAIAAALLE